MSNRELIREEEREGFTVRIYHAMDEDADLSFLGEFTDKWAPGAIEVEETDPRVTGGAQYFVSCNHRGQNVAKNWRHVSNKDRAEVCRKFGSLRKAEEHYAREDMERLEDYNRGNWYMVGVIAEVFFADVELAQDSVWGVESDAGAYFAEVESNVADEALTAARAKLVEIVQKTAAPHA